jgi:tRNA (adenine22-N1)-methyltransferase
MELSKRLYAVAGLVTEGASVADVGTDHGYVAIYLIQNRICSRVIALDVNQGPLDRAKEHIREEGLEEQIETRLSDGCEALQPGEVDTIITAGMGGGLVIKILSDYPEVTQSLRECILQPQSEIQKVREYLNQHQFYIVDEDMVEEDGKYYPMMKVRHADAGEMERYSDIEYLYGKRLLEKKHPVLQEYLNREIKIKEKILDSLKKQEGERIRQRELEIQEEIAVAKKALECYISNERI